MINNYITEAARNWVKDHHNTCKEGEVSGYIRAYRAGAKQMIEEIDFELLPACMEALIAISHCLTVEGDRLAPEMEDFVAVENALEIIQDFIDKTS